MDYFKQNIIPGEVLVQLCAFLTVFFLLRSMAWKKIQAGLAARRNKIQDDFAKIEKAHKEIESLKLDYETRFAKIEDEARAKLNSAIEEGRKIAKDIQDKARAEAQASFDKSKENLEMEIEKAKITLRKEVADLALKVAEKVVEEKMTDEAYQAKALKLVDQLEKSL